MNTSPWPSHSLGYSTVESLLVEVSHNMATSNTSRQSRGSIGQKAGPAMRVMKPNSANNSPRNSAVLGRRMTDGAYRRRMAMLEQGARDAIPLVTNQGHQTQQHLPSNRPVSWHPASQIPLTYTTYPDSTYQMYNVQQSPVLYSSYNSPSSTFSPYNGPVYGYEQQQQYLPQNRHSYQSSAYAPQQQVMTVPSANSFHHQSQSTDSSMYSHFDWNNFARHGFEDVSTTPPTPENFLPIQHPEPSFQEDVIPYQPLDESDDGEELIGMGLYDAPELKSPQSDPHLDNYRALMVAQIMGTPYRVPESTGKGLKLEETWAPPPSDDDEDSDQDGDGDDEEEEVVLPEVEDVVPEKYVMAQPQFDHYHQAQPQVQTYMGSGWL